MVTAGRPGLVRSLPRFVSPLSTYPGRTLWLTRPMCLLSAGTESCVLLVCGMSVSRHDKHKRLAKWEYRVVYIPLRNGLDLNEVEETEDGGYENMITELKYVHEWAIEQEWTPENVKGKLAQCKATAMSAHEGFASRGFGYVHSVDERIVTAVLQLRTHKAHK